MGRRSPFYRLEADLCLTTDDDAAFSGSDDDVGHPPPRGISRSGAICRPIDRTRGRAA